MADKNYRTDEADIYEWWYLTYPFEQYRAIMQATAERYIRIDEGNRAENLEEAIYILERLKEKEIEHDRYNHVKTNYGELLEKGNVATEWTPAPEEVLGQADFQTLEEVLGEITKTNIVGKYFDETYFNREDLLRRLQSDDYEYLARDKDGDLWAFRVKPKKEDDFWDTENDYRSAIIENDNFPEVKWADDEPTEIAELLEAYEKEESNNG